MTEVDPDLVAAEVLRAFGKTRYAPSPAGSFTILAAFILHNTSTQTYKVISLATGSKCLPLTALSPQGISIHDSHAEILARRGVLRWILLQLARQQPSYDCFEQLNQPPSADDPNDFTAVHNLWSLKRNLNFILYISTPPCGDASMTLLASAQEPEMRLLKDSNLAESSESALSDSPESAITLVRGRNNYGLRSALRTKPGRQDSPVTYSMSCSDKIARWNTIGIQGALLSRLVEPLFIADIVIGNIPQELHAAVAIDCDRAFWGRLQSRLPVHKPRLHFTTLKFPFSGPAAVSSNEALCWVEGCNRSPRGDCERTEARCLAQEQIPSVLHVRLFRFCGSIPIPDYRIYRPMLCKQSLFQLWHDVTLSQARYYDEVTSQDNEMKPGSDSGLKTYHEEKLLSIDYNESKRRLCGPGCPFQEWLTTGKQWESFSI